MTSNVRSMENFNTLVAEFAAMRVSEVYEPKEAPEVWKKVNQVNDKFASLVKEWNILSTEQQVQEDATFFRAQQNFHFVAQNWLNMLPNQSVHFGQFPPNLEALSSADNAVTFVNTTTTVTSTITAASIMATTGDSDMEVEQNEVQKTSSALEQQTKSNEKSNEEEAATATQEPQLIHELMSLSFTEHQALFQPVFDLTPPTKINEKVIDRIIQAIEKVASNAQQKRVKVNQAVQRTVILHVVSILDRTSQIIWSHKITAGEPTYDFLVNFLMKRKEDVDVQSGISAMPYTIPRKKMAGPSGTQPQHQ